MGATGARGGGLVHAIANDKGGAFIVRALTRDVNSDKGKALVKLGAEVVAANLDDVESLKQAYAGAYAAVCITNFWEHFSPEKGLTQAKNMAQAAKHANRATNS